MNRQDFLHAILFLGGYSFFTSFIASNADQEFTRDQLIGKGNPELVGETYLTIMHREAASALEKMKNAARKDKIGLEVVSAYRSFNRQKEIFEKKYGSYLSQGLEPKEAIEKIIEYSTIPGTSRHHWGTDLDLIDGNKPKPANVLLAEHFHGNGPFCKMKEWMDQNANDFGFFEVYTNNPHRKGFKYEPWHFSYAPVSIPMLKAFASLDLKNILLKEGIRGSDYFTEEFINKYRKDHIMDINPALL